MSRQEVDTLLDTLDGQGALARNDHVLEIGWEPAAGIGTAARALLSRVSHRFVLATPECDG